MGIIYQGRKTLSNTTRWKDKDSNEKYTNKDNTIPIKITKNKDKMSYIKKGSIKCACSDNKMVRIII